MPPGADATWFNFITQAGPFGVYAFSGFEEALHAYEFAVEVVSLSANVNVTKLLGTPACLSIADRSGGTRLVHGLIRKMEQLHTGGRFTHYRAVLVPRLWFLGQITDYRIFQNLSVDRIILRILHEQGFTDSEASFDLSFSYEPREYCVQYGESNLDFICRLCEEEGIYFYFEHTAERHVLRFCDREGGPRIGGESELRFCPGSGNVADSSVISRIHLHQKVDSNAAAYGEWNFTRPRLNLHVGAREKDAQKAPVPPGMLLERYRYPHLYALRESGTRYVKLQLARQLAFCRWIECESDVSRYLPGYTFTLRGHPRLDLNAGWWIVSVQHRGEQPGVLEEEAPTERGLQYSAFVRAIPETTRYVQDIMNPKRLVEGVQTAIVTGPDGEEIYTDKYGRVKVHFHWDREGLNNEKTSCWVRVSQGWAGTQFGAMAIPRVGHEVVVSFLEGDPDRPLITGRVHHELNKVPYELPANKTRTMFKSMSTPGKEGEPRGFNELRIEDKAGEEEIYVHGEKDLNIYVKNDWKKHILRDFHLITEGALYTVTKGETHEILEKNRKVELRENDNLTVHGDSHIEITGKWLSKTGDELYLKAEEKLVLEAGTELVFKAGGSWITLNASGVHVGGMRINLGGGEGPLNGTDPRPESPEEAVSVDEAGRPLPPAGVLTEREAQEVFDELKNNPDIPFACVSDCCYARAHEMCRIMKEKGIPSNKTWYFDGNDKATLVVPKKAGTPPLFAGGFWRYHVAPTVKIVKSNGTIVESVMDPSIFSKPVPVSQWRAIMDSGSPSNARIIRDTSSRVFLAHSKNKAMDRHDPYMRKTTEVFRKHQDILKIGKI